MAAMAVAAEVVALAAIVAEEKRGKEAMARSNRTPSKRCPESTG